MRGVVLASRRCERPAFLGEDYVGRGSVVVWLGSGGWMVGEGCMHGWRYRRSGGRMG